MTSVPNDRFESQIAAQRPQVSVAFRNALLFEAGRSLGHRQSTRNIVVSSTLSASIAVCSVLGMSTWKSTQSPATSPQLTVAPTPTEHRETASLPTAMESISTPRESFGLNKSRKILTAMSWRYDIDFLSRAEDETEEVELDSIDRETANSRIPSNHPSRINFIPRANSDRDTRDQPLRVYSGYQFN